jgi:hypothetical protein
MEIICGDCVWKLHIKLYMENETKSSNFGQALESHWAAPLGGRLGRVSKEMALINHLRGATNGKGQTHRARRTCPWVGPRLEVFISATLRGRGDFPMQPWGYVSQCPVNSALLDFINEGVG